MKNINEKYFLAANSFEGFVSHFADCYSAKEGWRCVIIKGGPGTGKSSFMKYIAARATDKGYAVVLCPCSSDPNSLDAVIIPDIKLVLLDGTAPHIVEPRYPAVCEEILNLGEFWDREKIIDKREAVITACEHNRALHKTAARYLAACGQLFYDNLKISRSFTDSARAQTAALRLADKYTPKKGGEGHEQIRFITGITPLGVVSYTDTVNKFYKTKIIIEDKFGGAAGVITETVRRCAIARGYNIITLKNAFMPSELCDHILIPELSLAVVTEHEYISFGGEERRIHARRFADAHKAHEMRARMLFNRRVMRELLISATTTLERAKASHDILEKYYVDAMDFDALARRAPILADKFLDSTKRAR